MAITAKTVTVTNGAGAALLATGASPHGSKLIVVPTGAPLGTLYFGASGVSGDSDGYRVPDSSPLNITLLSGEELYALVPSGQSNATIRILSFAEGASL